MLKIILILIPIVVIAFIIVIALRPADFSIMRSAAIAATPGVVFAQVNDFHNWEAWSPWAKIDPNAKNTFAGPASGAGAAFSWSGNKQVGAGHMLITESLPYELIKIKLDFIRPFKATNVAVFTFKPEDDQTVVTWTMSGQNNFFAKAFSLFINCDKMVGGDFEKGLAQLNSVAQTATKKPLAAI